MKKLTWSLMFCGALLLCTTSCNRRCKGGGWYGNRNLTYSPSKDKADLKRDEKNEKVVESANP